MWIFSDPPKTELIRRREVITWLGITTHEVDILVQLGILHRVHLRPSTKGYFRVSEIRELIFNESIPPPDNDSNSRQNGSI
jgi:hypothetical protein